MPKKLSWLSKKNVRRYLQGVKPDDDAAPLVTDDDRLSQSTKRFFLKLPSDPRHQRPVVFFALAADCTIADDTQSDLDVFNGCIDNPDLRIGRSCARCVGVGFHTRVEAELPLLIDHPDG